MTTLIDFFVNIGKLKGRKRRGWQVHQIKNSESAASHIFRMAILAWLLGKKQGFNIERVIKMALIHDICEVLTEDETPYDPLLPEESDSSENRAKIEKILKKWPNFSLKEKEGKAEKKFKREKKAFLKLISPLPVSLKMELEELWMDFEKGFSKEGEFVKQADKAENLLQGIEYWKEQGRIQKDLWIRWAKEIFDNPVLIKFVEAMERRFFQKDILAMIKRKEETDRILEFLIEIGKLKRMPKKGLVLIGMEEPRTIGEHIFRLALMSWILAREKKTDFNMERILKISLCHDICEVYAGDSTPYDEILPKSKEEWPELFDKWPRLPGSKKIENLNKKYKKEKSSLLKLISPLSPQTKREVLAHWIDYEKGLTKEGRFVKQVNRLETLLQALEVARETKKPPFKSWWIGSKERIDDPLLINFMNGLSKEFSEVNMFQ